MENTTNLTASGDRMDNGNSANGNVEFALQTVVSILTVLFNLVLVVVLVRLKSSHLNPSSRYLLIYGAITHMCIGLILLARQLLPCIVFGVLGIYIAALSVSGYFLFAIDTYIAISRPFNYKIIMTSRLTKALILAACLFWAGLLLMSYLLGYLYSIVAKVSVSCTVNDGNLSPTALATTCGAILGTLVATMFTSTWNILLLKKITSRVVCQMQSTRHASTSAPNAQGPNESTAGQPAIPSQHAAFTVSGTMQGPSVSLHVNTNKKNKSTRHGRLMRLLMASLLMTSLCWPPLLVTTTMAGIYDTYNIDRSVLDSIRIRLAPLTAVDGIMHPIIAVVLSSEIRSAAWMLLPCKCKVAPQSQ